MANSTFKGVEFRYIGGRAVEKYFGDLSDAVKPLVVAAVKVTVEAIYADSQRKVPVLYGMLKKSGKMNYSKSGLTGRVTYGGKGARHSHLIEFGTVRAPAYPFLRPALKGQEQAHKQRIARATAKGCK